MFLVTYCNIPECLFSICPGECLLLFMLKMLCHTIVSSILSRSISSLQQNAQNHATSYSDQLVEILTLEIRAKLILSHLVVSILL